MPEAPTSAQPQPQQAPPMGVSPATGPTPNKGFEAAAMQKLGSAINQLMDVAKMAGPTSEMGKAALEVITKLSKHVPPGAVTPASEANNIQNMGIKNAQNMQTLQAMKQGGGAPGGGQAPPPMPQAA